MLLLRLYKPDFNGSDVIQAHGDITVIPVEGPHTSPASCTDNVLLWVSCYSFLEYTVLFINWLKKKNEEVKKSGNQSPGSIVNENLLWKSHFYLLEPIKVSLSLMTNVNIHSALQCAVNMILVHSRCNWDKLLRWNSRPPPQGTAAQQVNESWEPAHHHQNTTVCGEDVCRVTLTQTCAKD